MLFSSKEELIKNLLQKLGDGAASYVVSIYRCENGKYFATLSLEEHGLLDTDIPPECRGKKIELLEVNPLGFYTF